MVVGFPFGNVAAFPLAPSVLPHSRRIISQREILVLVLPAPMSEVLTGRFQNRTPWNSGKQQF